jgi:hypothetical protein
MPAPPRAAGRALTAPASPTAGPSPHWCPPSSPTPGELLAWRSRSGGLLYRTRTGREPPRLRPTVIVLDVSPPCFGPVERLTRPAAHALAHTLRRQGLPVVLVAAGGRPSVHLLEHPADLLVILTRRTLQAADPAQALATAQALRRHLADDGPEPFIVLLTQPWWGGGGGRPGTVVCGRCSCSIPASRCTRPGPSAASAGRRLPTTSMRACPRCSGGSSGERGTLTGHGDFTPPRTMKLRAPRPVPSPLYV